MATGEMTPLEAALRRAVEILREERLRWAVVGGLAVSARGEPRTTRDVDVPVARTGHLIALKALARNDRYRPQDLDDVRSLLRVAASRDLDEARRAVALIEARGFARGRRLSGELEALLRGEA